MHVRRHGWRRGMCSKLGDEGGAIAIEFAFVAPVLLILLLGTIQFGYAFFVQINMNNAAREAARGLAVGSASVGGATSCSNAGTGTAESLACDFLAGLAVSSFILSACDPDHPDNTLCPGDKDVTVKVTIPRSKIALGDILGFFDTGTMEAQVTMRREGSS